MFVEFARQYYRWMESEEQPLWWARRVPRNDDVDRSVDAFMVHFKEKYLNGIQLDTTVDTRTFVKHALDLYRSKGSERSVDLLFRLVFGVGAKVYYPRQDVMRLSSGKWVRPQYVELSLRSDTDKFVGRQVQGSKSGAVAFAERLVRRKLATKFVDVLYLSAVVGDFQTGERINLSGEDAFQLEDCPSVVGSLSELVVVDGSFGHEVGELVTLEARAGRGGVGRVRSVKDKTGSIDFELVEGGWGYTTHAQVAVSEQTLILRSATPGSVRPLDLVYPFETLTQPQVLINYVNANGALVAGANLFSYDANGVVDGSGLIVEGASTTNGTIRVALLSGDLEANAIYTTGNAVGANLAVANGYNDVTATGNVVGVYSNCSLYLTNVSGEFSLGEEVYSDDNGMGAFANGRVTLLQQGDVFLTASLANSYSVFGVGSSVVGRSSGATGVVDHLTVTVGVKDVTGTFHPSDYSWAQTDQSGLAGYVSVASQGTGASVDVSHDFSFGEENDLCVTMAAPYANVMINANTYGMPNGFANLSTLVVDSIDFETLDVGKVVTLVSVAGGEDYNAKPVVRVWDPITWSYGKRDFRLFVSNAVSSFVVGELVTQESTGARGIVTETPAGALLLQRASVFNDFSPSESGNTSTLVVGDSSGAEAFVNLVERHASLPKFDVDGDVMGFNALVETNLAVDSGSVIEMDVVDSGYGYEDGEQVTFTNADDGVGVAQVRLGRHGKSQGHYADRSGFLSSDKKLFDGLYYQDMSYEVRSPLPLDKYESMLKRVVHVAGMKSFAGYYYSREASSPVESGGSSVEIGD